MSSFVVFIKVNTSIESVKPAIGYAESSFISNQERFYYTNRNDTKKLGTIETDNLNDCWIVFIEHRDAVIKTLYVGNISRIEGDEDSSYQIFYYITEKIISPLVIDNFIKYSTLSIADDFEGNSHISFEDSSALAKQLVYAVCYPRNIRNPEPPEYQAINSERELDPLAQKNEYCQRMFNILSPSEKRGEYQRDYDRIVNSKAFRRMVDKAQIFTSSKGDHYRTRMTHTLCVVQIARSIASELNMNVPLTEAIALGHDLGHTPFGHQGERTLDDLARKCAGIGFKHNFQSMRVASVLEEEYVEYSGLDLSVQVLEGMWKHTRIRKDSDSIPICDVKNFLP